MKVYQLKLCVRGNPAAMQTVLVEAVDYKEAIVKSIEKLAKMNNIAVEELAVQDIKVIEELPVTFNFGQSVAGEMLLKSDEKPAAESIEMLVPTDGDLAPKSGALETIDILRVDECHDHKNREIVGEEINGEK